MHRQILSRCLMLVVAAVLGGSVALAWEARAKSQDAPKPGPEHEHFKKMAGTWDAVIKMGDNESKGTMEFKMGPGDLWQIADFKGEMMGAPFTGHSIGGYDPNKKKYVGVWVDSMTPTLSMTEGTYDKDSKTFTEWMESTGPDGQKQKMKMVTTMTDDDHMTFKMYTGETVMMTIEYSRKK